MSLQRDIHHWISPPSVGQRAPADKQVGPHLYLWNQDVAPCGEPPFCLKPSGGAPVPVISGDVSDLSHSAAPKQVVTPELSSSAKSGHIRAPAQSDSTTGGYQWRHKGNAGGQVRED